MRFRLRTLLMWATIALGAAMPVAAIIGAIFFDELLPLISGQPPPFRFTIRDGVWLAVVVGLILAWAVDRFRWRNSALRLRAQAMEYALQVEGFTVEQDQTRVVVRNAAGAEYEVWKVPD